MTNPIKQNAARRELVNFCCFNIIGTSFTPHAGQRIDLSWYFHVSTVKIYVALDLNSFYIQIFYIHILCSVINFSFLS